MSAPADILVPLALLLALMFSAFFSGKCGGYRFGGQPEPWAVQVWSARQSSSQPQLGGLVLGCASSSNGVLGNIWPCMPGCDCLSWVVAVAGVLALHAMAERPPPPDSLRR